MSLTFSNMIYDEAGLPDVDTDAAGSLDSNVASLSAALTSQISAALFPAASYPTFSGATAVTQYAELTNFVTSPNGAAVTNYSLARDSAGDGFATSGAGVATGLYVGGTAASNEIFLYGTSDPNVVIGRIGSDSGQVAMVIALNETKDGSGHVTGTDLGIEMFAPLMNSDGSHVDDADTTSMLSGALFVYETHSTVQITEFKDFSKVPSGDDAFALIGPSSGASAVDLIATGYAGSTEGTVNVSTTGLGANAQTVATGSSLRIDIVTANAADFAKADTSPEVHLDSNISYQNHVQANEASFELTQTNPTGKPASLTVSAWEDSNNLQGHSFVTDATASEGTSVRISASNVKIFDDSGNDITSTFGGSITQSGNSVLITGLMATDHVDFMGDSQFDRFTVTNTQTGPNDKTTFDVGDITVKTITGGIGHDSGDLGPSLIFEDGGPSLSLTNVTLPNITVDEDTLGAAGSKSADLSSQFSVNYGPDGAGAASLSYALSIGGIGAGANSTLVDTATMNGIFLYMDGNDVVGRVGSGVNTADPSGTVDFRISVDSTGKVTFEQDHAVIHNDPNAADEAASMSSASLVNLTASASDGDGDSASSPALGIGTIFSILDDEPHALGAGSNVIVGNTTSATDPDGAGPLLAGVGSGSFATFNAGNDGVGSFTIVGPADSSGNYTWAYNDNTDTSITESYKGSPLFSLALDSSNGSYTMTMLGTLPDTQINLDANNIKAGGPTGSLVVGTLNDDGDTVLIQGMTNVTFNAGAGTLTGTTGAVNASNGNVGVNNGNLDGGEVLEFQLFSSGGTLIPFFGLDMGTKTAQSSSYHLYGIEHSDGKVIDLGTDGSPLLKGGTIHYAGNVLLDGIYVVETAGNAVKVGLSGIHLLLPPTDAGFNFTAQLADGDGDHVSSPFNVFIDGNNDGVVDTAHVLFPA
jgi:hypothetical protein